jgi:ribosomal protein S18 acetylase RimI-like enzyme
VRKKLISGYNSDPLYFGMLDELAFATFEITLSKWKECGFIGPAYIPYSFAVDGKIAANVSANIFSCEIHGQVHQIVQLGTVMTDPAYRHLGLAGKLMQHVLSVYQEQSLFIFLFANQSVLEFYPRFGFSRALQRRYVFRTNELIPKTNPNMRSGSKADADSKADSNAGSNADLRSSFRPVFWENEMDRKVISEIAASRVPLSDSFGLIGDALFISFLHNINNSTK